MKTFFSFLTALLLLAACNGNQNKSQTQQVEVTQKSDSDCKIYNHAVESAVWGMPIVAFDAMRQAFLRDAGANYNDIVYWSKQADWKFQVTTPNASSWYVYIAINTKKGPIVLDIPPASGAGLFGSMNNAWQIPQADVGPTGLDQGKGGKYLLLPPDYKEKYQKAIFLFSLILIMVILYYVPYRLLHHQKMSQKLLIW